MTTENVSQTTGVAWTQKQQAVGGGTISYLQGGSGARSLLVLPHENGHPPQHAFLDRLTGEFSLYYPWLPGFHDGEPGAWDWLTNPRDLAVVLRQFVEALGLQQLTLVGCGFGGWLAAEMATMASTALDALVLIAPLGIKPTSGFIYDQFLVSTEAYARAAFKDQSKFDALYGEQPDLEQLEHWETDREMTSRLAWKPYMYNPALPQLLTAVATPALILCGDADEVAPRSCAEAYLSALSNAQLDVVPQSGHALELEQPEAAATRVSSFLQRVHGR
jgi:pimeloyl-ACP methyl ester carboxylesterase